MTTITTDELQFAIPQGFHDDTQYVFNGESPQARLMLEFGLLADVPSNASAEGQQPGPADIIALQRKELELGVEAVIDAEREQPLLERHGLRLDYRFDGTLGRTVVAPLDQKQFLKIDFLAPDEPRFGERFEELIASVSHRQPREPVRSDWVRRQVRDLWIDMPRWLESPRRFLLVSSDGQTRMTVAIFAGEEARQARRLAALEEGDRKASDAIEERTEQKLPTPLGPATIATYVMIGTELGATLRRAVTRAELATPALRVQVAATGPEARREASETAVKELLESLAGREIKS